MCIRDRPKNVDPKLKTQDILKNKDEVIYVVTPILSKPKPRPAPEQPQQPKEQQEQEAQQDSNKQQGDMDVD